MSEIENRVHLWLTVDEDKRAFVVFDTNTRMVEDSTSAAGHYFASTYPPLKGAKVYSCNPLVHENVYAYMSESGLKVLKYLQKAGVDMGLVSYSRYALRLEMPAARFRSSFREYVHVLDALADCVPDQELQVSYAPKGLLRDFTYGRTNGVPYDRSAPNLLAILESVMGISIHTSMSTQLLPDRIGDPTLSNYTYKVEPDFEVPDDVPSNDVHPRSS